MSRWDGPPGAQLEARIRELYRIGCHPAVVAESVVAVIAEMTFERDTSLPLTMSAGEIEDVTTTLARRVLGALLEAGWTMPPGEHPETVTQ